MQSDCTGHGTRRAVGASEARRAVSSDPPIKTFGPCMTFLVADLVSKLSLGGGVRTHGQQAPVVLVDYKAIGAGDGIVVLHQRHRLRQALQRRQCLFRRRRRRQLQLPRRTQVTRCPAAEQLGGRP